MQPPNGITIDTSEQGSESWLQARLGKFTASRASDLMLRQRNGQPYASRKNYLTQIALERLTQELPDEIVSEAMQEGTAREPVAALAYEFATGNETESTGLWHNHIYGASPDRLIVGKQHGVEFKNPNAATHYHTLMTGNVPDKYYWQIIQTLYVTGYDAWDYVSYHPNFPENAQLFVKTIRRSDVLEDIDKLATEINQANNEVGTLIDTVTNYKGI